MSELYFKYKQVTFDENGQLSKNSVNYVINPIQTSHYYLPTRDRLNDPSEGVFNNQLQKQLFGFMQGVTGLGERQELAEPVFERAKEVTAAINTSGIFSLTSNPTDELMWAHYADSHRGIAIEYDLELLTRFTPKSHLHTFDVEYEKGPPELGINNLASSNALQIMLGYKSPRWSYEEEYRVLVDNINGQIPHDFRAVKSVTFGLNFPADKRQMIIDLISCKVSEFFEIKNTPNSYIFERVPYKQVEEPCLSSNCPKIDWENHLAGVVQSEKESLIRNIESIIQTDPHYAELVHAEKSSIEVGKYCVQYLVTHELGLSTSTKYTKVLL
jgi:hypothetical protein